MCYIVYTMHITWHGQYTVRIQTKDTGIVLDPHSPDSGLSPLRAKTDIVALSNPASADMSYTKNFQGDFVLIDTPGEYSFEDVTLHALGWHADDGTERNLQRWTIEGVTLLHVGALQRDLSDDELRELERTGIDILLVPVGGGSGLTADQALNMVSTIEPRIVIPIHYNIPKVSEKLEPVDNFAKEMGVTSVKPEKKYTVRAKQLPQDEVETVILSA